MTDTKSTSGIYPRLSLAYLMQFMIWGSWATTLSGYADKVLNLNAGILNIAIPIAAASALFIGPIVDRKFAAQKMLALLHFCGGLCLFFASTATSFNILFISMLLHGLFFMPTIPLINSIVFRHIPNANNAPRVFVFGTFGWIIVNLIVAVFLGGAGNSNFLIVGGTVSIILAIYALMLPDTPPIPVVPGEKSSSMLDVLVLFKDKSFSIFTVCVVVGGIAACGFYFPMMVPLFTERNYPAPVALTTLNQFSEILFMLALPFFAMRIGLKKCILLGLAAWCVRYIFFMPSAFSFALIGLLLHGFCYSFLYVASYMYAEKKAPASLKTSVQGLMAFLMLGVGQTLGSLMYGYEIDQFPAPVAKMDLANPSLPTWNDPDQAKSALRFLDLSGTINGLLGKEAPKVYELGQLDINGDKKLTWDELEAIPDDGILIGVGEDAKKISKDDLLGIISKVAKHAEKKDVALEEISVTHDQWLEVQTKQWDKILLWPALLSGVFFVIFLIFGKDPVPDEVAGRKEEE